MSSYSPPIKEQTDRPGYQYYYYNRTNSTWRSAGKVKVAKGSVCFNRKSASSASDHSIPTNYSRLKTVFGTYYNSGVKYIYNYKNDGTVNSYVVGSQSGVAANHTFSYFTSCPFGIFKPAANTNSVFMTLGANYQDEVNNKLLEKIDDQSINLGAVVAELGETVSYLSSAGRTLFNFGSAILSGRFNKALKEIGITKRRWNRFRKSNIKQASGSVADQVASRWIEFNFAIKPTLSDVSNISQLYNDPNKVMGRVKCRASARTKLTDNWSESYTQDGWTHRYEKKLSGFVTAKCTYTVSDPETIASKALGLNNIPSAALEAAPFSWLVDYVVNLGEFISLLSATDGLVFQHGYISMKAFRYDRYFKRFYSSGAKGIYNWKTYNGSGSNEGYVRQRVYSFPQPSLRFVLPELTLRQASYALSVGYLLKRNTSKIYQ